MISSAVVVGHGPPRQVTVVFVGPWENTRLAVDPAGGGCGGVVVPGSTLLGSSSGGDLSAAAATSSQVQWAASTS